MLAHLKLQENNKKIILASKAQNRKDALENIGLNVEMVDPDADETLDKAIGPEKYVQTIAARKVEAVKDHLEKIGKKYDLIIGADTVVYKDGEIYTKPNNGDEAYKILKSLSGAMNVVYTGVALKQPGRNTETFVDETKVYFGPMTDEQIWAYIRTGEPETAAGGYRIQGLGGSFIEKVDGNYFNVLGLPAYKLCKRICEIFEN